VSPRAHRRLGGARFRCTAAVSAIAFLQLGAAAATFGGEAPRLSELVRKAKIAGLGRVTAAEDLDYGRIRIHDLVVDEELKPGEGGKARTLRVVSIVDEPGAAILDIGSAGVAFVRPLRRNSYLDLQLPERGSWYQFVDGRDGWLEAAPPDRLEAIAAPVRQLIEGSRRPIAGSAARARNQRDLVFKMLSAPHPLLVANGIADLSTIPDLASSLSEEEVAILTSTLHAASLPLTTRENLIDEIATLGLRRLIEPLRSIREPALQEPAWAALRELGAPVSADEVRQKLTSEEPRTRLAAARELLDRDGDTAIPVVAQTALRDRDKQVRLGAIEALGGTGSPAAIAPLEGVFATDEIDERQATARALREIGGDPAADALHRLAFQGSVDAQRYAVVVLMTLDVGRDDRRVRDIVKRHPDAQIQDMLEHGLEAGHGH
jgi:hypothetical protein